MSPAKDVCHKMDVNVNVRSIRYIYTYMFMQINMYVHVHTPCVEEYPPLRARKS